MKRNVGLGSFVVGRQNGAFSNFSIAAAATPGTNGDGTPAEDGGGVKNPPILGVLPSFPDPNTMSCPELNAAIQDYKLTLNAPSFTVPDPLWQQAYVDAINAASAVYNTKCNIPGGPGQTQGPTKQDPIPGAGTDGTIGGGAGTPGQTIGGPIMGGGAGASAGTKSTGAGAKKTNWILWLALAGIAAYALFGGKSSSN